MIRTPEITSGSPQVQMTTTFGGYNHRDIIQDGEMYDMENLSGDKHPLLSVRRARGITSLDAAGNAPVPLTGIHGRDQLVHIRGTEVFYGLTKVEGIAVSTELLPKKIVSFGAYVLIWPDKVYFNTTNLTDRGSMERVLSVSGSGISMSMCRGDGTDYEMSTITIDADPPANPTGGQLWLDESGENDVLRQWSSVTEEWVEVATTYVKISGTGIGSGLSMYDVVDISGLAAGSGITDERVRAQIDQLNASAIVYFCGENYIVVAGLLKQAVGAGELDSGSVSVSRTIPDMDYVVESNNRLWGCRYGLSGGAVVNEILASALGDFRNWSRYMQNSQDSYRASVGTDGPWTGAVTQRGYPVFFKENYIHKVGGQTPGTFTIQTTVARGVQSGSWRSVAVVSENVYYKHRTGVMMYDGNMPVEIGSALGDIAYTSARAGTMGTKYYISMQDAEGAFHLFCYNTETGAWYREDNTQALGFGTVGDELYFIDEAHNTLVTVGGSMGEKETDIPWSATFGLFGTDYRAQKYLGRFDIRMEIEAEHEAALDIQYDEDEDWTRQGVIRGRRLRTTVIPVVPRRCDHLRFRLSGTGACRIFAISRILEVGGDGGRNVR